MQLKLDRRFQKKVKGMFSKYQFEVGVLDDGTQELGNVDLKVQMSLASMPVDPLEKSLEVILD